MSQLAAWLQHYTLDWSQPDPTLLDTTQRRCARYSLAIPLDSTNRMADELIVFTCTFCADICAGVLVDWSTIREFRPLLSCRPYVNACSLVGHSCTETICVCRLCRSCSRRNEVEYETGREDGPYDERDALTPRNEQRKIISQQPRPHDSPLSGPPNVWSDERQTRAAYGATTRRG